MTIAVMTRASLGHTGQALSASDCHAVRLRLDRRRRAGAGMRGARAGPFGPAADRSRASHGRGRFWASRSPMRRCCAARASSERQDDRRQHITMDDELLRDGARVAVRRAGADGRRASAIRRRILLRPIRSFWCTWSASAGSAWRCAARCSSSCPSLSQSRCFRRSGPCRRLACLTAGLVSLLAGFLALGGRLPSWLWLLPLGAVLLVAGFGLVVVDLGLTAWLRPTGPARFVLVGLASLCATVAFGAVFAFALAGWAGSVGDAVLASGIPLHAIAGLGGWLTLTAMGVSYRLLSMFMLVARCRRPAEPCDACGRRARHRRRRWSAASSRSGSRPD